MAKMKYLAKALRSHGSFETMTEALGSVVDEVETLREKRERLDDKALAIEDQRREIEDDLDAFVLEEQHIQALIAAWREGTNESS